MRAPGLPQLSGQATWICSSCRSRRLERSLGTHSFPRTKGPAGRTKSSLQSVQYDVQKQQRWMSVSPSRKAAPTRTPKLPDGAARTRFAPSPTGYLHIGGLRTALFSYLLAKRTESQFVLRIEDTDQKRLVQDAEQKLFDDLRWAGLQWDEGPEIGGPYGPYTQSLRNEIYESHALELLQAGQAYRCFCTPQTAGEAKAAYVTSGCYQNCSSLSTEQSEDKATEQKQLFTVRLRQPADAHKRTYPDLIYGNIQRLKRSPPAPLAAAEDDIAIDASDTILVKSDGTPTYHFANVVDDHLMNITHVIRGSEWMASTPLHYDIYSAFDWKPPQFAHVGLLVDQNKAKLSKRNADLALDVASMRDKHGVLPGPLINFLALLGWSNPTNNDVMELHDLVRNFDLKFTRGNAMVKTEKLWFLQKAHVANQCARASETDDYQAIAPLVDQIIRQLKVAYPKLLINTSLAEFDGPSFPTSTPTPNNEQDITSIPPANLTHYIREILLADSKSYQNASQFIERNRYFFAYDPAQVPAEQAYYNKAQTLTGDHLHSIAHRTVHQNGDWDAADLEQGWPPLVSRERGLANLLALEAWTLALDFQSCPVLCDPPERMEMIETDELQPSDPEVLLEAVSDPDGGRPEDVAEVLMHGYEVSAEDVKVLVKRFRVVNGGLMKWLREKVCEGLPGPHVSAVMAILGRGECVRRLSDPTREPEGQ